MATVKELFEQSPHDSLNVHFRYGSNTGLFNWYNAQACDYKFEVIRIPKILTAGSKNAPQGVRVKIVPPNDINYAGGLGALFNVATLGLVQAAAESAGSWLDQGRLIQPGATVPVNLPIPWGLGNDPMTFMHANISLPYYSQSGALVKIDIVWDEAYAKKHQTTLVEPKLSNNHLVYYISSGQYIPPVIHHNPPTPHVVINPSPQPPQPVPQPTPQPTPYIQPVIAPAPVPEPTAHVLPVAPQPTSEQPVQPTYGQQITQPGLENYQTTSTNKPSPKSNTTTYLIAGAAIIAMVFLMKK